uniref:Uncharacterized protein n=1 Tax=Arundo donax TaxID=35708 RepID=A0A0A8YY29_ARUDO
MFLSQCSILSSTVNVLPNSLLPLVMKTYCLGLLLPPVMFLTTILSSKHNFILITNFYYTIFTKPNIIQYYKSTIEVKSRLKYL